MNQFKTMTKSDVKAGIKFFHRDDHHTMEYSFRKQFGKDLVLYKRHTHQVALVTAITDTGFDISIWLFNQEATVHIPYDEVHIIDVPVIVKEVHPKRTAEQAAKQIGLNFIAFADEFFGNKGLDCYVPRYFMHQQYLKHAGHPKVSLVQFEQKLSDYADLKSYTYNPLSIRDTKGKVNLRSNEVKFDYTAQEWIHGGIKQQAMIYMQSPSTKISNRVFDPTI